MSKKDNSNTKAGKISNGVKIFLIDGNSFCYRAFYAIRNLSTSRGEPTNAVYGFISMLRKIIKDEKPDYLGIAFDMKAPTFRHEKYDDYKAHRKPMPDSLIAQVPVIKEVVRAYNIPIFEKEGFEADDILATIAKKMAEESLDVYIVTGDKDMLQLVGPRVRVYSQHKEGLVYDEEKVIERYGVPPEKIADLIALMGDSSDNIPGVPGFGEKTAVSMMKDFKSLEDIIAKPEKIKQEARKKLLLHNVELARLSRELAVLDDNVPLEIGLSDFRLKEPDAEKLLKLFKRFEFKKLIKEYTPERSLDSRYHLVKDKNGLDGLIEELKKAGLFAFDFETTSADPMAARPIGISFSFKEGEAYYIAFKKNTAGLIAPVPGEALDRDEVLSRLKELFENSGIKKVGQNIKYEYIILRNYGIKLEGIYFDTMIASYLLNPSKPNHNLDDISMEYLNHKMIPLSGLIGKGKKQISMEDVDVEKVSEYSCEDADVTLRLMITLDAKLKEKGLRELFRNVEIPLAVVLAEIEIAGVSVDTKFLAGMSGEMEKKLNSLTKEIYELAGGEFNIKSHQQLSHVLFEKLKLPPVRRTKTHFSTDESVLRKMSLAHPIIGSILEYRRLSKLKSTYIDAFPQLVHKRTGKVHTSFNQTVTATGRLSSSNPNLQNIPIKTEIGREIRKAFIPSDSKDILVSADYSQIELRFLAHLSEDKNLINAFNKGRDIHTYTAALIFGVKEKEVTKKMRSQAKTANFGIIYGISPYGLSKNLGMNVSGAEEFIKNYFERYPDVKAYLENQIKLAGKQGYVTTMLNRRRYIPEINSPDNNVRQFAERTAINTPIQGSAADLIKIAMLNVFRRLEEEDFKSRMILQVHDELLFEVKKNEAERFKKMVKFEMEGVFRLKVPVVIHIAEGRNWF